MQIIQGIAEIRQQIRLWKSQRHRIALVPTMGNLHRGHIHLVEEALLQGERIVVSIFVNPLQFGAGEDFEDYPRTLQADAQALEEVGAHALFAPHTREIYPRPLEETTRVTVSGLSEILCGVTRPVHFTGVTTVVNQLFNIIQPDVALFGEKDFQQLIVIQCMVRDLWMPVEVLGVPTVREPDGLAMSSRNTYLGEEERSQAAKLYATLQAAVARIRAGERDFKAMEQQAQGALRDVGFRPDYVSVRRQSDLGIPQSDDRQLVILAAAWLGRARLIDNLKFVLD